jgi:hypothetical protein
LAIGGLSKPPLRMVVMTAALMLVIIAVVLIAIVIDLAAAIAWVRRRWR